MTVQNNGSRDQYTATSGQTVFPYTFEIFDKADLAVDINGTLQSEGTNYSVAGVGADNGGTITLTVGATTNDVVTIYRNMPFNRLNDYQQSGDFLAEEVNDDFDRLWLALSQINESNRLALRAPITDSLLNTNNTVLPSAGARAGTFIGFDNTGQIQYLPTPTLSDIANLNGQVFNSFDAMVSGVVNENIAITRGYYAGSTEGSSVFYKTSETGTPLETNGGSYFYDAAGNKWVLQHNGEVSTTQFGFVADYDPVADTGTNNSDKFSAMAADTTINKIVGAQGNYYFGLIANSTSSIFPSKGAFNRPIELDWQGAHIFMGLTDENAANQSACFVAFFESNSSMRNYEFTHIGWDRTKAVIGNRGIFPVIISSPASATKDIQGFEFENVIVHRGQGFFAASSGKVANGFNYRSSGIVLKGQMHGEEVYYGCSLFHSGSNTRGFYTLTNFIRSIITYDASDLDIEIRAFGDNAPTSASLLIYSTGDRPAQNIKIKANFNQINGPISMLAEDEAGSAPIFDNWDIDAYVGSLGTNLGTVNDVPMRIGSILLSTGVLQETGTYQVKQNCKFRIKTGRSVVVNNYFFLQTTSPNIQPFYVDALNFDISGAKTGGYLFYTPNGLQIGHRGNLQSTPLELSLRQAINKDASQGAFFVEGTAVFTVSGSSGDSVFKKFWLKGSLTSGGLEVLELYQEYESNVVGTYNPTITMTTEPLGSEFVTIGASAGGSANGRHVFTFRNTLGGSLVI